MGGIFITFEGIDGAGKSSHIQALAQAFAAQGRGVTLTREPGGTALAEKLRALLLHEPMDALTEALLAFAGRRDHLKTVILPALARGDVVLCDRFTDATFAYQGGGRGLNPQTLSFLELTVQAQQGLEGDSVLQPDLTVWFDLDPAIAAQRLADARAPDRFEAQDTAFFTRVANAYAQRAAQSPGRFVRLDAAQTRDHVWQQLHAAVQARGWLA